MSYTGLLQCEFQRKSILTRRRDGQRHVQALTVAGVGDGFVGAEQFHGRDALVQQRRFAVAAAGEGANGQGSVLGPAEEEGVERVAIL